MMRDDPRRKAVQPGHMGVWPGERPLTMTISSKAIAACPTTRMDVEHFRPDGTCMCVPPNDESLEPHLIRGED